MTDYRLPDFGRQLPLTIDDFYQWSDRRLRWRRAIINISIMSFFRYSTNEMMMTHALINISDVFDFIAFTILRLWADCLSLLYLFWLFLLLLYDKSNDGHIIDDIDLSPLMI